MGNDLTTPEKSQTQDSNEDEPSQFGASSPPPPQQQNQLPLPPNQAFTCEICMELINSPTQRFKNPNNKNCGPHPFCKDCMIKYIQAKLDDHHNPKIPCPALNCSQFLDPPACRNLVGPQLFVKWCDSLCESAVMRSEWSYCPSRSCSALIVNECGGNVKKAKCPECKCLFCFRCKIPWHAGFRCEGSGELGDASDRAFWVLVEQQKWMRCPQCHHFVELNGGCEFIKCRCAITFCYRCGRKLNRHSCNDCFKPGACEMFSATFFSLLILSLFILLIRGIIKRYL